MNEFKARSTLGSEAVPVFDDDGELTEWLHRDNYTVEELELMNFVGKEWEVSKRRKYLRDSQENRMQAPPTLGENPEMAHHVSC